MSNNTVKVTSDHEGNLVPVVTNNGDHLPFRELTARNGNLYWAISGKKATGQRYYNKMGVNVTDKVISELPETISVGGTTIRLTLDLTEKEQRRVRGTGKVTVEGYGVKSISIRVTELGPDTYNISGAINAAGGPRIVSEL